MKASEIEISDVVRYLKLEEDEYQSDDIQMLIDTAKAFISSYTGIKESVVSGEALGVGDGEAAEFLFLKHPVIVDTIAVSLNGELQTKDTDYHVNNDKTGIIFATTPLENDTVTASYKTGIDAFEEFSIAIYVLCQDMHDNRSLYVDKTNLNKVVDAILGMHRVNLL
ncbi:MAG: hypothetical protein K0S76_435 [Herbinix sp.]|jgi:hypothetical protein|nr:hypothetical protein [Herbinix sp.]